MTLSDLSVNEVAIIQQVYAEPEFYKRLYALGLRAGTNVLVIRRANCGGPMHVRVGTTDLILRTDIARCINVSVL